MDLWIRSQDKKHLIKINQVKYDKGYSCGWFYRIYNNEYEVELGTYANEERALEVLEEIQERITMDTNKLLFTKVVLKDRTCIVKGNVYEMPKE